jgi:hypothetical protein
MPSPRNLGCQDALRAYSIAPRDNDRIDLALQMWPLH